MIISDVRLYREGLEQILGGHERIRVVESVQDVEAASIVSQNLKPDVILLDMATSDALVGLHRLVLGFANSKVVAFGVSECYEDIVRCAEAGVSGYVFRNDSVDELVTTLEQVLTDELRCSERISAMLLQRVAELAAARDFSAETSHLTPREFEILQLLGEGLTNKEIANRLIIELSTVKNHVHNLLEKLHAHTRGEAVAKLRTFRTPAKGINAPQPSENE